MASLSSPIGSGIPWLISSFLVGYLKLLPFQNVTTKLLYRPRIPISEWAFSLCLLFYYFYLITKLCFLYSSHSLTVRHMFPSDLRCHHQAHVLGLSLAIRISPSGLAVVFFMTSSPRENKEMSFTTSSSVMRHHDSFYMICPCSSPLSSSGKCPFSVKLAIAILFLLLSILYDIHMLPNAHFYDA